MGIGEKGFDSVSDYIKLITNVFHDNNYKLRRDGVIFLKDYFASEKSESVLKHPRFEDLYLPELLDLL